VQTNHSFAFILEGEKPGNAATEVVKIIGFSFDPAARMNIHKVVCHEILEYIDVCLLESGHTGIVGLPQCLHQRSGGGSDRFCFIVP
jgi:hypothetical protein